MVAPSPGFVQSLLGASDVTFQKLLALAANRPDFYKHLLCDPAVAARLERLGSPVRHWLEQRGPVAGKFDDHIATLATAANQSGPVVRGEVIRVAHGTDFFTDVFWDTAGPYGARGTNNARDYLDELRDRANP